MHFRYEQNEVWPRLADGIGPADAGHLTAQWRTAVADSALPGPEPAAGARADGPGPPALPGHQLIEIRYTRLSRRSFC